MVVPYGKKKYTVTVTASIKETVFAESPDDAMKQGSDFILMRKDNWETMRGKIRLARKAEVKDDTGQVVLTGRL